MKPFTVGLLSAAALLFLYFQGVTFVRDTVEAAKRSCPSTTQECPR